MNREIKFILLFVPFLLFALALGVVTKRSWIDNLDANAQIQAGDTRYLNLSDDEEYERGYLTPDAADEDSLKEVSEYILKVELNGKRINFSQSILSQVKVLQVYKDKDDILPGDEVIVYEPCSFRYDMLYYSLGGYNIMQEGKQYLLFLRYARQSHLNPSQKGRGSFFRAIPKSLIITLWLYLVLHSFCIRNTLDKGGCCTHSVCSSPHKVPFTAS